MSKTFLAPPFLSENTLLIYFRVLFKGWWKFKGSLFHYSARGLFQVETNVENLHKVLTPFLHIAHLKCFMCRTRGIFILGLHHPNIFIYYVATALKSNSWIPLFGLEQQPNLPRIEKTWHIASDFKSASEAPISSSFFAARWSIVQWSVLIQDNQ